ncbi:RNase H family protein [Deinococcus hohokamensis]|uniref:RNase H family protein n=1 Tax=Deinococcus hohokamensis TaxID=309883 RepID=A0ABV9I778_9DEIO
MNQAYVDASWHELPDGSGVGGWGLVLLTPGALPARFQGQLSVPDNNVAELRAVLEAVRLAPTGEPLSVYTDNQAVIAAVARQRGPEMLHELAREVQDESSGRAILLRVGYVPRTRRHMLTAHELANDARRGSGGSEAPGLDVAEVLIEQRAGQPSARVSLRRRSERVTAHVPFDPLSSVPPSVQALLAAVSLAQPHEILAVRRASKIAQALWLKPERALRDQAQAAIAQARQHADEHGVQVQFQG